MKTIYAALVALALATTPAHAAFYEFSFNGWATDQSYAYGTGTIETAGIDLSIPVFLRAGGIKLQQYQSNSGPANPTPCNATPWLCHPVGGLSPMSISSVRWIDGGNLLFVGGFPFALPTSRDFMPLSLTAVPGPIAGGLPALVVGLFAAFKLSRRLACVRRAKPHW